MLTYLALGDSYTIGEQVPLTESFPVQLVQQMRHAGMDIAAPEIVARTGWTTDELAAGIAALQLRPVYDFVSLLIGVNNQYRGRAVSAYKQDFTALLDQAIGFANGRTERVAVLSIPDWGVTPFAEGRDRQEIAREIDAFNAVNRAVAAAGNIHYIYITDWTREAAAVNGLLAADGLHPSGKEYTRWAEKLQQYFSAQLQ